MIVEVLSSTEQQPQWTTPFRELHSSSPSCLAAEEFLTLDEFAFLLPRVLSRQQTDAKRDRVAGLFRRLVLHKQEWKRYAHVDPLKNYTRNLIATDHKTFSLILMCWNPGRESPIHDHPCDGCWVRVCEGSIREVRYVKDDDNDVMRCTSDNTFHEGQLAHIDDSMGYHKIGNPSSSTPAVTLHLYSPPFDTCKIWLNPSNASKSSQARICFYTEYGEKV